MYRPANYYAARAAAIREALEEERAQAAAAAKIPVKAPTLYSLEALRNCGALVSVTLGIFFDDLAGTVVEAVYCYEMAPHIFLAKFTDEHNAVHFVQVTDYSQKGDIYNYAISEIAVL